MMQAINLPSFSQTQYYDYDEVNRLKVAAEGATIAASMTCPATSSWCREYGYDHFGNRWVGFSNLSLHMATPTSAAAFQATTNRLTAASYDAAGNLTAHPNITIGGGTITYDANNKHATFTKTGNTMDTWYDAQDLPRYLTKGKDADDSMFLESDYRRVATLSRALDRTARYIAKRCGWLLRVNSAV